MSELLTHFSLGFTIVAPPTMFPFVEERHSPLLCSYVTSHKVSVLKSVWEYTGRVDVQPPLMGTHLQPIT